MTDANVDTLIRKVNQLVVQDTGGVSFAPPELAQDLRDRLEPLADNLDIPGRLAPTVPAALGRGSARDPRADIRAALTELVATCANSLEPPASLPEPSDPEHRTRLAAATGRAYAAFATPRLVPQLFPDGREDDLGRFPPPQLEGDVAAARAMALAISARTGLGEEEALTELVADGHGAAAPAAVQLLLRSNPEYLRLPEGQRGGIARQLARDIESGFAGRDLHEAATRELTEELEARRQDVTGGAGVIDVASAAATRDIRTLHEFLERIGYSEEPGKPAPPGLPTERAQSVPELLHRIQGTVGELTGAPESLWNGEHAPAPDMTGRTSQALDGTLHLSREAGFELLDLTRRGPGTLDQEELRGARAALQEVTAEYARMAVPEGHPRQHGLVARLRDKEFTPAERAVSEAFAADNFNDVVVRTLPPELAAQVMTPEPPPVGTAQGQAALGFANAVDNRNGLDIRPSESLRVMAGSADIGSTAGQVLTANSELPESARPAAVRAIAATVDRGLTDLPPGATADQAFVHGQELARKAYAHTLPAEPQLDEVRGIVAERLVSRVEHHAGIQTLPTDDQLRSPAAATDAAAATMVTASTIPHESRPAATTATATMLTEGFDELPARLDGWRADGSNVRQQAELYGAALGDRTLAAVRTFERQPPNPRAAQPDRAQDAAYFASDPAVPPLRRVQAGESRRADDAPARSRNGGPDGLTR